VKLPRPIVFTANFWGGGEFDLGRKKLNGVRELCVFEGQVVGILTSQDLPFFGCQDLVCGHLTGLGARICLSRGLCLQRTTE
jgi:hypothetical protein